jgi:hypothetical protein
MTPLADITAAVDDVLQTYRFLYGKSFSRKNSQKISSGLSVINELIADGEKALHPTDRSGDYAVRLSGLKLVL